MTARKPSGRKGLILVAGAAVLLAGCKSYEGASPSDPTAPDKPVNKDKPSTPPAEGAK